MSPQVIYPAIYRPLAPRDLIRVGGPFDGGYILPERVMRVSRGLLSFGLGDDCSFEDDFTRRADCRVVCFDHTVNSKFWLRRTLHHLRKGISHRDAEQLRYPRRWMTYRRLFVSGPHRHVRKAIGSGARGSVTYAQCVGIAGFEAPYFLKVDIEGAEYRVMDDIVAAAPSLSGIVLELHDIDLHTDRIARFLAAIAPQMALVHFHPNLLGPLTREETATVVELTLLNRSLLEPGEALETRPLPLPGIDAPNEPHLPQPQLGFT